jgi:signal transduction histidine kinase
MVRLIEDLLDVSRIARGNLTLKKEAVNLGEVLQGAVEICRPRIDQRKQRLNVHIVASPLLQGADRVRLTHVFANLLLNASKFSPSDSEIEVTIDTDAACAVVCIKDHGIGLTGDELGKVFEMYSQVQSPVDGSTDGLGIGLGLAKAIVELHSGSITVKSEGSGRGCEFIVRIPCSTAC